MAYIQKNGGNRTAYRKFGLLATVLFTAVGSIYYFYNYNYNKENKTINDNDNDNDNNTKENNLIPKYEKTTKISLIVSKSVWFSHPDFEEVILSYLKLYTNLTIILLPDIVLNIKEEDKNYDYRILKIDNIKSIPFLLNQLKSNINLLNLDDCQLTTDSNSLNLLNNVISLNNDLTFLNII